MNVTSYAEMLEALQSDAEAKPLFRRPYRQKFPQDEAERQAMLDVIELLGANRKSLTYIATRLGVDKMLLTREWCKHTDVKEALDFALQSSKAGWEDMLEHTARTGEGNANAIIHAMKGRFRGRDDHLLDTAYGDKQEVEHSGGVQVTRVELVAGDDNGSGQASS